MATVSRAARPSASQNTRRMGGGGGKAKKRKGRGDKNSFTISAWVYFTFPPPSSPFSHFKNKYIKKKSRGNDSLMLLHKSPVALLPVVFLLQPEQTLFSCPSSGDITTGKCFPSHTLSWLEIIYMQLIWKLHPSPSSTVYLQGRDKSLGKVSQSRNLLSL